MHIYIHTHTLMGRWIVWFYFLQWINQKTLKESNSIFKHYFWFLIFEQLDCRENLHWGWVEKVWEQLMHKKVAVKICCYGGGAMQCMYSSNDAYIFLLCILTTNAIADHATRHLLLYSEMLPARKLIAFSAMEAQPQQSSHPSGLAWGRRPGAIGYGLAAFPLITYFCLPSPAKSLLGKNTPSGRDSCTKVRE